MVKRIQVSHNVVDKNILQEIKWNMIPSWQKYMLLLTSVVALIVAVINFVSKEYITGAFLILLCGACLFEIYWLNKAKMKAILKTMLEKTQKESQVYSMIFGNDALTIRNCDMSSDNKMPYESMKKIMDTESAYTIFGSKNQFAVIRKDCLKIKPEELFDFLKAKETRIKKWPSL